MPGRYELRESSSATNPGRRATRTSSSPSGLFRPARPLHRAPRGPLFPLPLSPYLAVAEFHRPPSLELLAGASPATQDERRRHHRALHVPTRRTRPAAPSRARPLAERMVSMATAGRADVTVTSATVLIFFKNNRSLTGGTQMSEFYSF